ncbi:MAG: adenine deaminase [Saprospiraceae bacterium]|nr:adenine deaminase [Saprospiraceae bacterium]
MQIDGHIIDVEGRRIFPGIVSVAEGKIVSVTPAQEVTDRYIMPGFVDAHIHIESSMLTPHSFAKAALKHGTVATVSDPHEIANVCGMEGVRFMIDQAKQAGLKIFYGAPSCVPATSFECAGATIGPAQIEELLSSPDIWYLSEMMNYPGVIAGDPDVLSKIDAAKKAGKPVDGHSPGLTGSDLKKYIQAGIITDHECISLPEAEEKLSLGMKILIREGSAACNFEALHPLIEINVANLMFCSDDRHPDDLLEGHINLLVKRALHLGYDVFDVLQIACINPVRHYKLPVGTLRVGDPADFIVVANTQDWTIISTFLDGKELYGKGKIVLPEIPSSSINHFATFKIRPEQLQIKEKEGEVPVIKAIDGAIVTEKHRTRPKVLNGLFIADARQDLLKICVVNRYHSNPVPALGWITGFGFSGAAIASTVAHDSHNIICVGDDDELMAKAILMLEKSKGGLSFVSSKESFLLPLPVAGLMTDQSAEEVAGAYTFITALVKNVGCMLRAPFMTLSFMALLVIPKLKISDLGMFDAESFTFCDQG